MVRTIVRPIPRPCDLVVVNGVKSVSMISGGTPVPVSRRPGHRVHRVDHQVHEHLLEEHLVAADEARIRRQIHDRHDLPRSHVVIDKGQAFIDHGMQIDGFDVQLTAAQHFPMTIDDLRRLEPLGLDIGQDLLNRAGRRSIGGDHHLQRFRVVDH